MLRNFAKSVPLVPCLVLMISLFAIIWPVAVLCIIDQSAGAVWVPREQADVYTWALWSPDVQSRVYKWGLAWMCVVGIVVGVDAALRIKQGTLPISRRKTRRFFFVVHTAIVLAAASFDALVMLQPRAGLFTMQQLQYLLLFQGLPVAWFLYSWATFHERTKRRRRRPRK